ncbi:MAG: hypothetical protein IJT82_08460 [Schwartzia sp.]|nr:hypothetical protein [Schwartzia sp. (in: firmicutes)]
MGHQTLKKVKITVLKVTFNQDLAEEYAVPRVKGNSIIAYDENAKKLYRIDF